MTPNEMPLGAPIPDDPTDPDPRAMEDFSDAEIENALADMAGEPRPTQAPEESAEPEEPEPEAAPVEAKPDDSVDPASDAKPEVTATEHEPEPVPTLDEIESQKLKLERDRLAAELELQKAHGSRLAARIGNLEKQRQAQKPVDGDLAPAYDDDRLVQIQSRLDALDEQKQAEAKAAAIHEEVAAFKSRPELAKLTPDEMAEAAKKYADDWSAALDAPDPTTARLLSRAVLGLVAAEASGARLARLEDEARQRSTDERSKLRAKKLAAAPPESAPVAAKAVRAKSVSQMTDAEVEAAADAAIRSAS